MQKPLAALKDDLLASLVVFLVAVPLALGISVSSGAPSVMAGLIGCVAGGIVVGFLGGAPLQVSGPAAGLTVITFELVQKFGWAGMCAVTVFAGCLQLLMGYSKLGKMCLAISPAVVHGMLAGIGVVIAVAQLHVALGGKPQSSALQNLLHLPDSLQSVNLASASIAGVSLLTLVLWPYLPLQVRQLPSALAAVLLGTLAAVVSGSEVRRVSLPANLGDAFSLPLIPSHHLGAFLGAAVTVALVASVESLLCAVATDRLHANQRANLDKELVGQGAGNIVSGLIGGLPITGVIVRSSANISSGAQSNWSSILHGLWVVVFVLMFSSLLEQVPLAALAGLLIHVGIKLINLHHIRELVRHSEIPVYVITLLSVVYFNLLEGVAIGMAAAFILLLRRLSSLRVEVAEESDRVLVRIQGIATFVTVPRLVSHLQAIPVGTEVSVNLEVDFMDHGAYDALQGWRVAHEKMGGSVQLFPSPALIESASEPAESANTSH